MGAGKRKSYSRLCDNASALLYDELYKGCLKKFLQGDVTESNIRRHHLSACIQKGLTSHSGQTVREEIPCD